MLYLWKNNLVSNIFFDPSEVKDLNWVSNGYYFYFLFLETLFLGTDSDPKITFSHSVDDKCHLMLLTQCVCGDTASRCYCYCNIIINDRAWWAVAAERRKIFCHFLCLKWQRPSSLCFSQSLSGAIRTSETHYTRNTAPHTFLIQNPRTKRTPLLACCNYVYFFEVFSTGI